MTLGRCEDCKSAKYIRLVNYGELTSLGGEIKVPHCWLEVYVEDLDDCLCANWESE